MTLRFVTDGAFTLDVANDPSWLLLRPEPFAGPLTPVYRDPRGRDRRLAELAGVFIDRVVLFVDGHEVRPSSAEYIPPPFDQARGMLAVYRLHGRIPAGARSLRWFYGLVMDPYPLTLRFADGSSQTVAIEGEAWSGPLDLSGRFQAATPWRTAAQYAAIVLPFLLLLFYRWRRRMW